MANQNKSANLPTPILTVKNSDEICRFCLSDTKNSISIHDKCPAEEPTQFEEESIYNFVTNAKFIKMEDCEKYPSQICDNCYGLVKICNDFRLLCQKSDVILRDWYDSCEFYEENAEVEIITQIPNDKDTSVLLKETNSIKLGNTFGVGVFEAYKLPGEVKQDESKLTDSINSVKHSSPQVSNVTHNQKQLYKYNDQSKLKRQYYSVGSTTNLPREYLSNSDKFVCFYCDSSFQSQNELVKHLNSHKTNNSKCLFCTDTFPNNLSLNEHLLTTHPKQLVCAQTDLSADVSIINLIPAAQRKGFRLICRNCNPPLEFTSTGDFITHINTHNTTLLKSNRRKCPQPGCVESFTTNRQLIQHGIVAHQKYFAYHHKVFKRILQSKDEESRVKNYECDICQKRYIYKTSLKKHIFASHLGKPVQEPVVCSYCGKTLSSKLNLKSHIEFMHEALYVCCPICKKKINFRTIGKHYKTHKTNREYSKSSYLCNLCGKILKSKRSFEDHQKLHKNIRDEVCDICGSGFTTKKFLRLHKKTHEGIRRKAFGCDQCDKVFSGRQTLNRHLLTHSGKKNFICEICSKCFYTLQELNRHVRCHKKEYRFDCQLCDMRFLDKSRFRHHMMRHRNVRPHKCQFCDKMFIVRGKMYLHMAAKHNVEVENRKGVWKDPKTYVPLDDLL